MSEWQTIDTAPLDGSRVLLMATRGNMLVTYPEPIVGAYRRGWWAGQYALSHVTHWMTLPGEPDNRDNFRKVLQVLRDLVEQVESCDGTAQINLEAARAAVKLAAEL